MAFFLLFLFLDVDFLVVKHLGRVLQHFFCGSRLRFRLLKEGALVENVAHWLVVSENRRKARLFLLLSRLGRLGGKHSLSAILRSKYRPIVL